jgi:hypothetical protein
MVLTQKIKYFAGITTLLLMIFCFSCEETPMIDYCDECVALEPVTAELKIKLKAADTYQITEVVVYEGNIEDSIVYKRLFISRPEYTVAVPLNKKYSLTARYIINGTQYIAVNSVTPRVRYDKSTCDQPCYYVYDRTVNLRLR